MGRRRRGDNDTGWFHVMNRGVDHQQIFFADSDRIDFGRLLGVGHQRFGVEVHAYCLMSNHFHLLLHCPTGGLSSYMHDLGSAFTRHVNDRIGRDGPLFRGRFRSVRVDTDAFLRCVVRYIHRNPLDISSVEDIDTYRWSSHRTYLGHRRRPTWLRTDLVLDMFHGDSAVFDQFVRCDDPPPSPGRPDLLTPIIELIVDEVRPWQPGSNRGAARAVSVLLLDQLPDHLCAEMLHELAFPTPGARRTAVSKARRLANLDPAIGSITERVRRLVA